MLNRKSTFPAAREASSGTKEDDCNGEIRDNPKSETRFVELGVN